MSGLVGGEDGLVESGGHGEVLWRYVCALASEGRMVDTRVESGGALVGSAHRLVLAAFSEHFRTALEAVSSSATVTLDVDPLVTGVSAPELKALLEWMYSGRCQLWPGLQRAAKTLGCGALAGLLSEASGAHPPGSVLQDEGHPARLLAALRRFQQRETLTDVRMNCEGRPLASAHRLVLCAFSEQLEQALLSTESVPLVTLDIDSAVTSLTLHDLTSILHFMYSGTIRVPRRRMKTLLSAGRALGVGKLVEAVAEAQRQAHQSSAAHSFPAGPVSSAGPSGLDACVSGSSLVDGEGRLEVGATEDVGSTPLPEDSGLELMVGMEGVFGAEEPGTSRELTAEDDYVDIYEEYVSGPRRGRRGGTYGSVGSGAGGSRGGSLRLRPNQGDESWAAESGEAAESSGETGSLDAAPAVTMSLVQGSKRRRMVDSYGYGLPEIIGNQDVRVPLLVGDQEAMMEKPFKCPYCDHRTKEKSAVEKHIRCIHTLEAPYKCRYCNQAFKVQSNLVRHIRAHTGEKPYVCKKCGAAYADKKNMDAHVFREHLKMKPLQCPLHGCSAKFWRQDRYNYHCRRQHNLEPPPPLNHASL